uniref:Pectinesterase inhibitor domain-containing protein n=1 Tax=Kalanchoe fedtschenkoi TaxID=63787 RepID=A0A7N0TS29_KALFE
MSQVHCSLLFAALSAVFLSLHLWPVAAEADLIAKTCQNTKFPNLCVSSLNSDPTSPNADTKGLAVIMVEIGVANATATSSYLSSQLQFLYNKTVSSKNMLMMKKVIKECADKYLYASNALKASLEDLTEENYDYAFMHISAAVDYPNACHNGFKRNKGLVYPSELAHRENGLKHICDVISGIVDFLVGE